MRVWMTIFGLAFLGCDDGGGGQVDQPDVGPDAVVDSGPDAGPAGELVPMPERFSVASVDPGVIFESSIELTNVGGQPIDIERVQFGGGPGIQILWRYGESRRSIVGIDLEGDDKFNYPIDVDVGQSVVLTVEYRPVEAGMPSGNVVVTIGGEELVLPIDAVAAEGRISVEPASAELGRVAAGTVGETELLVTNVGPGVLDVSGMSIDGPGTFSFTLSDGRAVTDEILQDPDEDGNPGLAPAGEFELLIRYAPDAEGAAEAELRIDSNDAETPVLAVPLRANVDVPCVLADPTTLTWGGTTGVDSMITVNIQRCSPAPLEITAVRMRPGTTAAFTLEPGAPETPITLDSDAPLVVTVHFVPECPREHIGVLQVDTDDEAQPTLNIPLSALGEGEELAECI